MNAISNRTPGANCRVQASLDIISHYTAKYQLKFNADKTKTKIVFTGSKADMTYFKETKP